MSLTGSNTSNTVLLALRPIYNVMGRPGGTSLHYLISFFSFSHLPLVSYRNEIVQFMRVWHVVYA